MHKCGYNLAKFSNPSVGKRKKGKDNDDKKLVKGRKQILILSLKDEG